MTLLNKHKTQAKVVDGKLILSCPDALTPVVWQMDLSSAKSSAFEVNKDDGSAHFTLISRKQGAQKTETIATFEKRDEAVQALLATSKALENAHGQIHMMTAVETPAGTQVAPPAHATPSKPTSWGKIAAGVMGIIIIVMLISMIQSMKPYTPGASGAQDAYSGSGYSQAAEGEAGVPMSADDFLRQN